MSAAKHNKTHSSAVSVTQWKRNTRNT